jgi:ribonuclease HI
MQVYTDGACTGNKRNSSHSRAGVGVYFGEGHELNYSGQLAQPPHTNQRAELAAIAIAVERLQSLYANGLIGQSTIYTDSQYSINCLTKWAAAWECKGWRTSKGTAVENQDLIKPLRAALAPLPIQLVHVRGHAGILGNERADALAVQGILGRPKEPVETLLI